MINHIIYRNLIINIFSRLKTNFTLFMTYKNEVALHYLLESIDRQTIYFLETMKNCYMAADLHFALLDYLEQGDFRTASTLLRADIEKLPICESLVADKVECVGFSLC